jgi:hypothetical protein
MAFTIPREPLPLDFQSFYAAINDILYYLDVIPQSWTRFSFEPSDEDAEKVRSNPPFLVGFLLDRP